MFTSFGTGRRLESLVGVLSGVTLVILFVGVVGGCDPSRKPRPTEAVPPAEAKAVPKEEPKAKAEPTAPAEGKGAVPAKGAPPKDLPAHDPPKPIADGEVVTLSGRATGYAPTIEDLIAMLGMEKGSGDIILTLSLDLAGRREAFCVFKNDHNGLLLSNAVDRRQVVTVRGTAYVLKSGDLKLEDCVLIAPKK